MKDSPRNSILTAGVIIGVGMGGFLDGILAHQILQIHNMLSAIYFPDTALNLEINMFWDGLFHALTWVTTAAGIAILWRGFRVERIISPGKAFIGSLIFGWGLFNLVEGLIDHHILHLHHVVERMGSSIWDYAFLGSGVFFLLLGWSLMRSGIEAKEVRRNITIAQN